MHQYILEFEQRQHVLKHNLQNCLDNIEELRNKIKKEAKDYEHYKKELRELQRLIEYLRKFYGQTDLESEERYPEKQQKKSFERYT